MLGVLIAIGVGLVLTGFACGLLRSRLPTRIAFFALFLAPVTLLGGCGVYLTGLQLVKPRLVYTAPAP
jgi:hypothetical protein